MEYTTRETRVCKETCGFEGEVLIVAYIDEDWSGSTWYCPRCGHFHEIYSDVRR